MSRKRRAEDIGPIRTVFIYGSVAKDLEDTRSDIDLMVIGDIDQDKLHEAVSSAENALGREVNYSIFDPADWHAPYAGHRANRGQYFPVHGRRSARGADGGQTAAEAQEEEKCQRL
ncbi:MAG: nucleotidyltransferase domain-containing protein [Thermoleophilia bacterium]|nr:nucleotidyltransferase domain-containing protein [Thermoleophilia bacterium]